MTAKPCCGPWASAFRPASCGSSTSWLQNHCLNLFPEKACANQNLLASPTGAQVPRNTLEFVQEVKETLSTSVALPGCNHRLQRRGGEVSVGPSPNSFPLRGCSGGPRSWHRAHLKVTSATVCTHCLGKTKDSVDSQRTLTPSMTWLLMLTHYHPQQLAFPPQHLPLCQEKSQTQNKYGSY